MARILAARRILFILAGLLCLAWAARWPPVREGDVWDYLSPLQALFDHGSPDVRDQDLAACDGILTANGIDDGGPFTLDKLPRFAGITPTASGRYFACHFWLYPLTALPAKALLWLLGANELAAFQVTNTLLALCALYAVLFCGRQSGSQRLTLAGLAAVSPVLWYLRWPSPEVFTWSLVLISLILLGNRQYVGAAVCAALAAMQNPPILFLALFIVLLAMRERRLGLVLLTTGGALLAFVPSLFYYHFYGVPNLIVASGGTDRHLISWSRTWSFLTDFNQGMLPYVPLALILSVCAVCRLVITKNLLGLGMVAVLVLMMVLAQTTTNWNSGATGMMRYATWMLPILAWLVAEFLPPGRRLATVVALAIAVQAGIVLRPDSVRSYLHQTPLACFVLTNIPAIYDPEPEIFIERQLHSEEAFQPALLPIPFVTNNWRITKLLTDRDGLERLPEKFVVDPRYLAMVKNKYQDKRGLFYLNPPKGKVKLGPAPTAEQFKAALKLALVDVPSAVHAPRVSMKLRVSNVGDYRFLPKASGSYTPLRMVYRFVDGDEHFVAGGFWELSGNLNPNEVQTLAVSMALPLRKGAYAIDVRPFMENVAWGDILARLKLNVWNESGYQVDIKLE